MTLKRMQWSLGASYNINNAETRLLRGGPGMLRVPEWSGNLGFNTDKGKNLYADLSFSGNRSVNNNKSTNSLSGGFFWRVGNHLFLSAEADCEWNRDAFQYVSTIRNPSEDPVYIMGNMVQRTYGLTFKAKVNITPELSIQLYGAPFTSTAKYNEFKAAANTQSKIYEERFRMLAEGEYNFRDPDFRFNEFRSNMVLRWEYRPGSILYLVWEHSRSAHEGGYTPRWGKNLDHMLGLPSVNTLMVKLNYWISL